MARREGQMDPGYLVDVIQGERIGTTAVWVLPNPSGLNAHYTPAALAELFRSFRLAVESQAPY